MKFFTALVGAAVAVTPTQKVIQLLDDMHAKGLKEKQDEEARFSRFTQWCSDTSDSREKSVNKGNDKIEQLKAAIQKAEADAVQHGNNIAELQASIAGWEAQQQEATGIRNKEDVDYQATHKDYSESLDALARAISTLKAQNFDRTQAESLLQKVSNSRHTPIATRRKIDSFLQKKGDYLNRAAPEANAYEFQSGGVVDLLEKLKDKFLEEKRTLEREEADRKHAYEMLSQKWTDLIENATSESKDRAQDKSSREADAAVGTKELAQTTTLRDEDQKYWDDTNAECRQKTSDYNARSKLRGEELEAIEKATEILSSSAVSGNADKHLPALAQKDTVTSFLFLKADHKGKKLAPEQLTNLENFLRERGASVNSKLLSLLATKVEGNPFEKVKKMIWNMIVRLQEEATEETEHKGWCDSELAANKVTRDAKTEDIEKLSARRDKLVARIGKLVQSTSELNEAISVIDKSVADATAQRNEEKEKNAGTVRDAKEAQVAVSQALKVLRDFYDSASGATSLTQVNGPAEDAPETFGAPYQGRQDDNTGVIGLLEVISSDFARLEAETSASEDAANREYKEFSNDSEVDKALKTTQVANNETARTQSDATLSATKKDLKGTTEELDSANTYYDKLKPSCVDSGATYEDRVARREEEIQSLKEALEIITSPVE